MPVRAPITNSLIPSPVPMVACGLRHAATIPRDADHDGVNGRRSRVPPRVPCTRLCALPDHLRVDVSATHSMMTFGHFSIAPDASKCRPHAMLAGFSTQESSCVFAETCIRCSYCTTTSRITRVSREAEIGSEMPCSRTAQIVGSEGCGERPEVSGNVDSATATGSSHGSTS